MNLLLPRRSVSSPQNGYTLVELIIVLVLVSVLAVVAIARFQGSTGYTEFTLQARLKAALRAMQTQAMQDTRSGFCHQINFAYGASSAFGPPSMNYQPGNDSATCATSISSSVPDYMRATSADIVDQSITLSGFDGSTANLGYIGFNGLGQPLTAINNCASGCRIDFQGESTASVCVSSEGYIDAC